MITPASRKAAGTSSGAHEVEVRITCTLADVHAALAYCRDHHDEVETEIAEEHAFAQEFGKKNVGQLQEKLKRRWRG